MTTTTGPEEGRSIELDVATSTILGRDVLFNVTGALSRLSSQCTSFVGLSLCARMLGTGSAAHVGLQAFDALSLSTPAK